MLRRESGELESEVRFHSGADVRRAALVDAPSAVFVLVAENPVAAFLETLLIAGSEQRVQQDVVGFERGVGFEFAAPVAIFVLLGEQIFLRGGDRGSDV